MRFFYLLFLLIAFSSEIAGSVPFDPATCSSQRAGTYFIVTDTFELNTPLNLPEDCVLDFQGGFFRNGNLNGKNTYIKASGKIFMNMNFSGTFSNSSVSSLWFGCHRITDNERRSKSARDASSQIDDMLKFVHKTNVKNIELSPGAYYIGREINYSCKDGTDGWNISIQGAGRDTEDGTTFVMGDSAAFVFDMNESSGLIRKCDIKDCVFMGHHGFFGTNNQTASGVGIVINKAESPIISNCAFQYLKMGIGLVGHTYFSKISSCNFYGCNNSLISLEADNKEFLGFGFMNDVSVDYQYPNCNTVSNCNFYSNERTIDWGKAEGCHILDCDFEGNKQGIQLGNYNYITNAHIERSMADGNAGIAPSHIVIGTGCRVSCDIWEAGGAFDWSILVNGDKNDISANLYGFFVKTLLAKGIGNRFKIDVRDNENYKFPSLFVCDPDDEVILNGYSNKIRNYAYQSIVSDFSHIAEYSDSVDFYGTPVHTLSGTNFNYLCELSRRDFNRCYISGYFHKTTSGAMSLNLGGQYWSNTYGFHKIDNSDTCVAATFNAVDKWYYYIVYVPYGPNQNGKQYSHLAYTRQDFSEHNTCLTHIQVGTTIPYYKGWNAQ